ncbi:MAG: diacylglycerol kinase family protein [Acidimicrobiales bacterium]|nr:hypothetical protein [Acidimicrobiales bacterium]
MTGPRGRLDVVANTTAGGGQAMVMAQRVAEAARLGGFDPHVHSPSSAAESLEVAREAVAGHSDRVVCVGGDGLVHAVLPALVGSTTALAIVAAGTGNDAVRGLGLRSSPLATPGRALDRSIRLALGASGPCDVLCCTPLNEPSRSIPVLTIAAACFPVDVNRLANTMSRPRGSLRYTIATLRELPRLSARELTLTLDRGSASRTEAVSLLAIANTHSFGGGTKIAPDAAPTDGLADVVVVDDAPRRDYLRLLPAALFGRHTKNRHVQVSRASSVVIEPTSDALELWGDGEPVCPLPARVEVLPAALSICGIDVAS